MGRRGVCVYGLGQSMGAAILLQSLASSGGFCAVAAEASFSTLREVAYDRLGRSFGAGPWVGRFFLCPVVESGIIYVRQRYGLDLEPASPERALSRTAVLILLVQGTEDASIPLRHARRLREAGRTTTLWGVPGCAHTAALGAAPEEFAGRILAWFDAAGCTVQKSSE